MKLRQHRLLLLLLLLMLLLLLLLCRDKPPFAAILLHVLFFYVALDFPLVLSPVIVLRCARARFRLAGDRRSDSSHCVWS